MLNYQRVSSINELTQLLVRFLGWFGMRDSREIFGNVVCQTVRASCGHTKQPGWSFLQTASGGCSTCIVKGGSPGFWWSQLILACFAGACVLKNPNSQPSFSLDILSTDSFKTKFEYVFRSCMEAPSGTAVESPRHQQRPVGHGSSWCGLRRPGTKGGTNGSFLK